MFDISLGELAVIGAVALVVIGPEKLPKVARTAGMLLGRAQRLAANFRADIERELHTAEMADLKQKLTDEALSFKDEMAESAASISQALTDQEKHILPPAPPLESAQPQAEEAVQTDTPKPTRRRRKAAEPLTEAVQDPSTEAPAQPTKAPRKRKAAEPQIDLFSEHPADSASTDWGDRR
ncbi:MAG: Sec-independent protein translocase protein TatB [Formivibrio sp.]|nr:Sec-independent protein translocase protein TatB [Formivibrio sp.]